MSNKITKFPASSASPAPFLCKGFIQLKKASSDPELKEFKNSLDELDWGKEEFEALEVPNEKDVIKAVIGALQKRLEELEVET